MLHKLAVVIILLSFPGATAQREVPKEIRARLFKQVVADYSDVRECVEQEEKAEENMTVEAVDLNHDGVAEYRVELSGTCMCGSVNCAIYFYRQTGGGGYESILEDASGFVLDVLKTSTKGYADLRVDARYNTETLSSTIYKFDGKQYREARSTLFRQDTGETKPASRRLQFPRGASSTTVRSKVSRALPDTFLVGARAGQVMSVRITAPRKSATFAIMTAKTTKSLTDTYNTNWTGTLPETGDYLIYVESDDARGISYSITVTIK
jgi:hypothetical protein